MKVFPTHIIATYGVIQNDRGEILMVKDRRNEQWGFPGGQVEVGENLIDGLKRETMEESGAEITVDKLYHVASNTAVHAGYGGYDVVPTKVMFGFICTYTGGDLSVSDETMETCWVPKDEVMMRLSVPNFMIKYQAFLDFDGTVQYLDYEAVPEHRTKLVRDI